MLMNNTVILEMADLYAIYEKVRIDLFGDKVSERVFIKTFFREWDDRVCFEHNAFVTDGGEKINNIMISEKFGYFYGVRQILKIMAVYQAQKVKEKDINEKRTVEEILKEKGIEKVKEENYKGDFYVIKKESDAEKCLNFLIKEGVDVIIYADKGKMEDVEMGEYEKVREKLEKKIMKENGGYYEYEELNRFENDEGVKCSILRRMEARRRYKDWIRKGVRGMLKIRERNSSLDNEEKKMIKSDVREMEYKFNTIWPDSKEVMYAYMEDFIKNLKGKYDFKKYKGKKILKCGVMAKEVKKILAGEEPDENLILKEEW